MPNPFKPRTPREIRIVPTRTQIQQAARYARMEYAARGAMFEQMRREACDAPTRLSLELVRLLQNYRFTPEETRTLYDAAQMLKDVGDCD